ncbi:MAG: sugar phosphate isomerase/epimerase [Clostridia bacterium]|nr:sugar phosphate isomerase/epimerase [Clostridia bacterium]
MKLSIFYDHVMTAAQQSGKSIDEILASAVKAGIEAVDINNSNIARDPEMLPAIHRSGMQVACSFEFYNWNKDEYQNYDRLKQHIANAKAEGQKAILVIPGFLEKDEANRLNALLDEIGMPDAPVIDPRLDEFMRSSNAISGMTEMLRASVQLAAKEGITVTLEDFDGYDAPFARALGLLWFMQNVDGLRYTFDTGNFIYSDERMEDGFALLKDYLVHVHTKDRGQEENCTGFKYKRGMAPAATGEGYLPIAPYVRKLLENGYDGYFAIEHYGHPDQTEAIVRSAKNLLACAE